MSIADVAVGGIKLDGGVGMGDDAIGVGTDGDIAPTAGPIPAGEAAAAIDETDGGPIGAGDAIFDGDGDIAAGVVAGVFTDGDPMPIGLGEAAGTENDADGGPIVAGDAVFD